MHACCWTGYEGSPATRGSKRWLASGANTAGKAWPDLVTGDAMPGAPAKARSLAAGTAGPPFLLDVIRPGYDWLYSSPSGTLFPRFELLRDREGFAAITARCDDQRRMTSTDRRAALIKLFRILMHNGGLLCDITPADCARAPPAVNPGRPGYS
jgi:hypothetical protein